MNKKRVVQLLRGEINRHLSLAMMSDDPVLLYAHLETAWALFWAESKLDRRGARCGKSVLATVSALCRNTGHQSNM